MKKITIWIVGQNECERGVSEHVAKEEEPWMYCWPFTGDHIRGVFYQEFLSFLAYVTRNRCQLNTQDKKRIRSEAY